MGFLNDEHMEYRRRQGLKTTMHESLLRDLIDADHVRRRVDDWERRLQDLYGAICGWLPEGWESRQGPPVSWQEPLMCDFGIARRQLPTLELFSQTDNVAWLWPDGLWVICVNGRLNLDYNGRSYRLYDDADNFAPPDWRVYEPLAKLTEEEWLRDHESLSRDWLWRVLT